MKNIKGHPSVLLLFTILFLSSCATIIQGSKQGVGISSNPTGAKVTIDGKDYGTTPVTADLSRKKLHTVKIELEGFMPYEMQMSRKVSGWIAGNIVFGGLIGLAVDAITGGMYKLSPDQIHAELKNNGSAAVINESGLNIFVVLEPNNNWEKIATLSKK